MLYKDIELKILPPKIEIVINNISVLFKNGGTKAILYNLLKYENFYFITIKNLPFCYLPDAEEHIIYTKIKNHKYVKLPFCKNCKFFLLCPGLPKRDSDSFLLNKLNKFLTPVPDLPNEIVIEVNKNCNLDCAICFAGDKQKEREVSNERIKSIIDEAYSLGIKNIRFTGGEPFLRKDIMDLLKYAKSKKFYVLVNTNATILKESDISNLEKYADNVLVSLQGYDYFTENILTRGGKLLKNKLDNIAKFKKSRIPTLRIGTIISKFLINNPTKYYLLIKALGIRNWDLYRPLIGRSKLNKYPEFDISPQKIIPLLRFIYKFKSRGINTNIANGLPFCMVNDNRIKYFNLLGDRYDDGHTRLIFDAQGFFKPSYFINKNLGTNIKRAWNHPFLKYLNSLSYLPNQCQVCKDLKWCLGGSRFWAKEYFGTYFAKDPWMRIN